MSSNELKDMIDRDLSGLSRAERRNALKMIKDEQKRMENIILAQRLSGAGYPIDSFLRATLDEVNKECLSGADIPYRNIWDVFSGFLVREKGKVTDIMALKPERDHAFNADDFFAHANEGEVRDNTLSKLYALPEDIIHNYSALGDVREFAFHDEDGVRVVMSGASFLRQGDRLYWIVVGGPIEDLEALTDERRAMLAQAEEDVRRANPMASEQQLEDILMPKAMPLAGTDDVWMTATMGLFNLKTSSHEIRLFMRDWKVSQSIFSDHFPDRYAAEYDSNPGIKRMVDKAVAEVEKNSLLFDIAEAAFSLPAYFAARVGLVGNREIETGLSTGKLHERKLGMKAPPQMRVTKRSVATLDFGRVPPGEHVYAPPRFQVEVDGFWRRLRPGAIGKDADGGQVTGMTWVKGHARWKDRPPKVGVVYIKSPIGDAIVRARRKAEEVGGETVLRVD